MNIISNIIFMSFINIYEYNIVVLNSSDSNNRFVFFDFDLVLYRFLEALFDEVS